MAVLYRSQGRYWEAEPLYLRALEITAALADELGDDARRDEYHAWAVALKTAIRERLWLPEDGLFSTYVTTFLDPAPARVFDLLGSALAVTTGVRAYRRQRSAASRASRASLAITS